MNVECSLLVLITNLKRLKPFIRQAKLLRKKKNLLDGREMRDDDKDNVHCLDGSHWEPKHSPQIGQNLTHFQINCEMCRLCPNSETNNMIHGSYTVPQQQSNGSTYARRCGFKYPTGGIRGVNTDRLWGFYIHMCWLGMDVFPLQQGCLLPGKLVLSNGQKSG